MTLSYKTRGIPSGTTVDILDNYEEHGFSQQSYIGKHVVTGGHNRPVILEAGANNSISAHLMGIKPPLLAPAVTVNTGGKLSGDVQVAVQRYHRASRTRGGISPAWPNGSNFSSDRDISWSALDTTPVVTLGGGTGGWKSIRVQVDLADIQSDYITSIPYAGEVDLSKAYLTIASVRIYGYAPEQVDEDTGLSESLGGDLRAALFQLVSGSLVQLTPWATAPAEAIPSATDAATGGNAPAIDFKFSTPVTLDPADSAVYYLVVQVVDVANTVRVYAPPTGSGFNQLQYSTDDSLTGATWSSNVVSTLVSSRTRPGLSASSPNTTAWEPCSIVKTSADGTDLLWIYYGNQNRITASTPPLGVLQVVNLTDTSEPIKYLNVGEGYGRLVPLSSNQVGLAYEFIDGATRKVKVVRVTSAGVTTDLWTGTTDLGKDGTEAVNRRGIVDFALTGTRAYLLIRETSAGRIVYFSGDPLAYVSTGTSTNLQYANQVVADPNTALRIYLYMNSESITAGVYVAVVNASGGLTSGPTLQRSTTVGDGGLAVHPTASPTQIIASHASGVYRSTDAGGTWSALTPAGLSGYTVKSLGFSTAGAFAAVVATHATLPTMTFYSSDNFANVVSMFAMPTGALYNTRQADSVNRQLSPYFTGNTLSDMWILGGTEYFRDLSNSFIPRRNCDVRTVALDRNGGVIYVGTPRPYTSSISTEIDAFSGPSTVVGGIGSRIQYLYALLGNSVYGNKGSDSVAEVMTRMNRTSIRPSTGALAWGYWGGAGSNLATDAAACNEFNDNLRRAVYTASSVLYRSLNIGSYTATLRHAIQVGIANIYGDNLYRAVANASLTIDTSTMHANEPESEAQGGSERYDAFCILLREKSQGAAWREVGIIDAGESFTFNEPSEALPGKVSVIDGFFETPGGFDRVANIRAEGSERLAFIGQPGFDFFEGIPGAEDYQQRLTAIQMLRGGSKWFLANARVGKISSVNTGSKQITLTGVSTAAWDSIAVGDSLFYFSEAIATGGWITVAAKNNDTRVITWTSQCYVAPAPIHTVYLGFANASLGTLSSVSQQGSTYRIVANETTEGSFGVFMEAGQRNFIRIVNHFYEVNGFSGIGSTLTLIVTPVDGGVPVVGNAFYGSHAGTVYDRLSIKCARLMTAAGTEVARAYCAKDAATGGLLFYSDFAKSESGVNGANPEAATVAEFRFVLTARVAKGDTRVRFNLPFANDYWHGRKVVIQGDSWDNGFIRKVVKVNPATGATLPLPEVELTSPWEGDSHNGTPVQIVGAFDSVWFTGSKFDNPESLSGLMALNLVPRTPLRALDVTSEQLYVFAEKDEFFTVDVANYAIPTDGQSAIEFAIEAVTNVENQRATFTLSSGNTAVDNYGRIYMLGMAGVYRVSLPQVELLAGQRNRFAQMSPEKMRRASLAFDAGAFPRPMLRIGGLGFTTTDNDFQLGYMPDIDQWVNLSDQAPVDFITSAAQQDGSNVCIFGGSGTMGIYGDVVREVDHSGYAGAEDGKNLTANGQGYSNAKSGFVGSSDITVHDAGDNIYALDVTFADSATEAERLAWGDYGTSLNCPIKSGEHVPALLKGVQLAKINVTTGNWETADVLGLDWTIGEDGQKHWTLYVQGVWSDVSAARYHWQLGGRFYEYTTREIKPPEGMPAMQITGFTADIEPGGSASAPWWMKLEVFTPNGNGPIDLSGTPKVSRVIPYTRLSQEARKEVPVQSNLARSAVVKVSGFAPVGTNWRIKDIAIFMRGVML